MIVRTGALGARDHGRVRVGAYAILVPLLLAAAFSLRMVGIDRPSIEQRETQSALLVRRWAADRSSLPAWEQRVLRSVDEQIKPIEPPIMEGLTVAASRLAGVDGFWFPRLLSSVFWVVGGVFVLLIGRRLTTDDGAFVAMALYLFWPYGVWHSRLFMPDALLVLAVLAAAWAILRYWEEPGRGRFALAAGLAGFATLVKPGVAFAFVAGLFVALALANGVFRRTLRDGRLIGFAAIAAAPAALYAVWGIYLSDVIWRGANDRRLTPDLLTRGDFWHGWWNVLSFLLRYPQPQQSLALVPLALAALGVAVARRGVPRATLGGLLVGYVVFALAYANYTSTHPYYSLALLPILSLAIGVLAGRALEWGERRFPSARLVGAAALVAVLAVAAQRSWSVLDVRPPTETIATYRQIGEVTRHTTRSIIIDRQLGTPAMYWGWIATKAWELDYNQTPPSWTDPGRSDYLIVVDVDALERHRGLRTFSHGLPVVARTDRFVVFDMRARHRNA